MIYLYAIIDRPDICLPNMTGLEGTDIQVLCYNDIGAVISQTAATEMQPSEADIWQHEAILESLMADRSVLPVRFGTILADESAVHAALSSHYDSFAADLKRVRGHVELGLRVIWDNDESEPGGYSPGNGTRPSDGSGRAYISAMLEAERKQKEHREQAHAFAEGIHTPLARLCAGSNRRTLVTPRLLLTSSYLVDLDQVETFRREVETLSSEHPELHLLCTGPWPPFSFVSVGDKQ
jgi:hypothetical protein